MSDAAIQSLSTKLHALWDNLDAEERRVFALAAATDPEAEVSGYAEMVHLYLLLPPLKTYQKIEWTAIKSPRDAASGLPTG